MEEKNMNVQVDIDSFVTWAKIDFLPCIFPLSVTLANQKTTLSSGKDKFNHKFQEITLINNLSEGVVTIYANRNTRNSIITNLLKRANIQPEYDRP